MTSRSPDSIMNGAMRGLAPGCRTHGDRKAQGDEPEVSERLAATLRENVVPMLVGRNARGRPVRRGGAASRSPAIDDFTRLLLDENSSRCEDVLEGYVSLDGDPQAVTEELLAPAARLVGDYWRMDICDFMQVTVVMTRIQRLFWRLATEYPAVGAVRPGRTALLAPTPGEQHSFGLSIVEDALRRDGWHVDCCGCSDGPDLFRLAESGHYALVGLSLSGTALLPELAGAIGRLRSSMRNKSATILVGGPIFVDKPELAFEVGADSLALNARHAVAIAALADDRASGVRPPVAAGMNWNSKVSDGQAGFTGRVPLVSRQWPVLEGTGR